MQRGRGEPRGLFVLRGFMREFDLAVLCSVSGAVPDVKCSDCDWLV